jgi:hypothetical protein
MRDWEVEMVTLFFIWTAASGKILTLDNFRKKHVIMMSWCCMCKKSGESIDHLLLHCEVAIVLRVSVFKLFDIDGSCLDG